MTIKTYLKKLQTESNVKGLWYFDDFQPNSNILLQFEEFKNINIEFIKDIRKEHINSMVIIKNLTNELFKKSIRLYSIWLDNGDVYYNISKDSLKIQKIIYYDTIRNTFNNPFNMFFNSYLELNEKE